MWFHEKTEQGKLCLCTWKTLGALTSEARADESVAENIPAMIKGPNPETMLITFGKEKTQERAMKPMEPWVQITPLCYTE